MATMLELPREIYLMVCAYLTSLDITKLAGVSRDHYLAVQQPLYSNISLKCYGSLVKLVGTLMKTPIVSHISPRQRMNWRKLSDKQLCERDIRQLNVIIDSYKDGHKITGAVIACCMGAISRKCINVKIFLSLYGIWPGFAKHLDNMAFPSVSRLDIFTAIDHHGSDRRDYDSLSEKIWDIVFSGAFFPDLIKVYLNTLFTCKDDLPTDIVDGCLVANAHHADSYNYAPPIDQSAFDGLRTMESIRFEYTSFLNPGILKSLFNSGTIPNKLSRLEIVNCPYINLVDDLETLATLLKRGLQLLRVLKLHLIPNWTIEDSERYISQINNHPEHHLCNIVRELGQKTKSIDLSLPFACNRMFSRAPKTVPKEGADPLTHSSITREPIHTLPQRLNDAGYLYRRLIFIQICREAHDWNEMQVAACGQEGMSWEVLYDKGLIDPDLLDWDDTDGIWVVSGHAPIELIVRTELERTFELEE